MTCALLRATAQREREPSAAVLDSRTLRSSPESGHRAGYDGAKRKRGSKVHAAVDTLGHLLALHATPATADDRAEVGRLAEAVQATTGESVEVAYVDQGYTGERAEAAAAEHGIRLEVVKLPQAKRGFVLFAPALGRRALLRLGHPLPPPRQRRRTSTRHRPGLALRRLRLLCSIRALQPWPSSLTASRQSWLESRPSQHPSSH